ncbi:indole-3-glycerol phosphate synthase TrpC [Salirhabdus salicampi]|uniref:indole-3-glycerol phosphate synthase TrpC n=1 Tax=Salirhabdus salicampi TaxID=476102 RepID=UPI0020C36595|nr:indole-3-glycerol phosphate synthase TrpC [Salirhabdus salicampi]MCP8617981.1 indole-3-glycerol phosphate synthase TrpC [Salirhabdus salicampi]
MNVTILNKILAEKEKEVIELKEQGTYNETPTGDRHVRSLFQSFYYSDRMNIIAEMKRASPSKGIINSDVDPVEQTEKYVRYGAGAVSVLTDTPFFKGTMEDLAKVRKVVDVPILCKDFMIDPVQINRAHHYGADVILLIVAALSKEKLKELYDYATSLGLEVLVEVHNEEELQIALDLNANIIGINNRNLKTFETSLSVTEALAKDIPNDVLFISESGFKTEEDAKRVAAVGAKGILVGETLMREGNTEEAVQRLRVSLVGEVK